MKTRRRLSVAAATAAAALALLVALPARPAAGAAKQCPWVGSSAPAEQRADAVLSRMTLDEEISMVHGASGSAYVGYVPAIARLCVPALKLEDGPAGVADGMTGVTQLPAPVAAAASFDPALMHSYGATIGAEEKGKGANVNLAPTVNIVRDPRWGRAFESLSEDPFLTARMGAADIDGIQSQGIMAQVKHWAVYNQETNRNTAADDAIVDRRTIHEIYMPAFEAAVKDADVASAMCSYSTINGTYACEHPYLLTDVLKGELGFTGFVTSDWGATHSTAPAANAGLDMQMPDDSYFGAPLKAAVQSGAVPKARLDDMVRRILREEFRFGLFDHPAGGSPDATVTSPAHAAVARDAAEQGAVLLKDAGGALPLDAQRLHSIAVIGQGGRDDPMSAGGGSAAVRAPYVVTPYDAISRRAGTGVTVRYAPGTNPQGALPPIPAQYLTPPSGSGQGLEGAYYADQDLSGSPALTRVDPQVDFDWGTGSPDPSLPDDHFSARWTGTVTPPATGTYTFSLTSDDGSRLYINGQQIIDNWRDQAAHTETGTVDLTAGQPAQITVEYYENGGDASVSLGWQPPGGQTPQQEAVDAAKQSDVAIVFADKFESEGSDLANIDLSADQNALIDAVAQANPNTIVVLNTGSAVTMPWLDAVRGVIEAWYPGQEDGNAIAALLFGDVNPSGKLPVTFPKGLDQVPANTPQRWPGVAGKVSYDERLGVGYRWYDQQGLEPLFPFGYGLSYTSFEFSHLLLRPGQLSPDGQETVSADITNTGRRAGADVVQLYLGDPASAGEPPRQLKGFQKVSLAPGETKQVHFTLDQRDLSYWDANANGWVAPAGTYTVMVGDSSRDLPLTGSFDLPRSLGPRYVTLDAPAVADPGSTATVTTTFANQGTDAVQHVALALTAPAGWDVTATSPASFESVPAGGEVSATWRVSVPAGAAAGSYKLSATASYNGAGGAQQAAAAADVTVPYRSPAAAFNNTGISDDSAPTAANFDGGGYSFSAQALASVGITPGATVSSPDGLRYTWPDVPVATPDNIAAAGQVIDVSGSGSRLGFLGAGAFGTQSGDVTVTYTDGSTSTGTITLADWYADAAAPGDVLVATTPHWNIPPGSTLDPNHRVSLYSSTIPLRPGKTVARIRLPSDADLHVFATAFG